MRRLTYYHRKAALLSILLLIRCGAAGLGAGEPGYQSWPLAVPASGKPGFTLLAPSETGVFFTNALAQERSITNHVLLNGSGVAAGDVDGDGRVDLYFCNLDGPNKLYRNLGHWRFEDVTDSAGVACAGLDATGAALADVDGDGDLDLIVNSISGGTHVFINEDKGHFTPAPKTPLLNEQQAGTSLALADMDGDGALDLYIANYRAMFFFLDKPQTRYSFRMMDGEPHVAMIDGRPLTDPEFTNRFVFQVRTANGKMTFSKEELGQVDRLYRNDGHGAFTHVPFTGGSFLDEEGNPLAEPSRDWGLSVLFPDLNGDGSPDIYVCNDFRTPDRIWLNDGHGRFRALPRLAIRQTCLSAMGVDVADINRDGYFDIFVADMLSTDHHRRLVQRIDLRPETLAIGQIDNRPQASRNTLQLSRGDGTYAETAQFSGLDASEWTWSPVFLDVDLDGYEDLLVSNGFERDTMNIDVQNQIELVGRQQKLGPREKMNLRKLYPRLATPNLAFRNLGDGRFADVSTEWGLDTPAISQGMCLADLDNDGDLDLVINNFNGPAGLYRNNASAPRIAVRLKGLPPNTRGIGAKIEVLGGPVYQSQEMICGGRYCSSDEPIRTFAAGAPPQSLRIAVTWRSGKYSLIEGVQPNRSYEIDEASAGAGLSPASSVPHHRPAFRDASDLLNHNHHEESFDDFARQPLLPGKLSQLGPGVCWLDVDGDGWEDLLIASGKGGRLAAYRNNAKGSFVLMTNAPWAALATRDQTAIVGTAAGVLVGSSNYEDGLTNGASVLWLNPKANNLSDLVPALLSSLGPLALADLDADGELDLFVGGRVVPGRYPEPATSQLYLWKKGEFHLDLENTRILAKAGLVSGAVFGDLDGDGFPELVLACEWGPVRIFKNDHGTLAESTTKFGLDRFKGWWNGVNTGDFDGDGRLDLVASNWGRNSRYEHFRSEPLRLYYGDFNGDGGVQTLEAYFDPKLQQLVPWRRLDDVGKGIPFVNARFSTFEAFSKANVAEILGDTLSRAAILEANWLESTVFLNRGDHFEPVVLPLEAQLAPAFAVSVGDLDGDGHEDIFLSQNFFAVAPDISRYDAGRSLWLRGDGHGQFRSVSGPESGLQVYGEQRGAGLCDYDDDGRVDLVVTQNGAQTKLFHNETARPGLRVRLKGPPGNPQGIGAVLRLGDPSSGWGPAREVHAGSGYWSQDSAIQVLCELATATRIQVRWPGGKTSEAALPENVHEIELDDSGKARLLR